METVIEEYEDGGVIWVREKLVDEDGKVVSENCHPKG